MRSLAILLAAVVLPACACVTPRPPANAEWILSSRGPLPLHAEFSTASDRQILVVSGSAWARQTTGVRLEVQVLVDGAIAGRGRLLAHTVSMNRALVFPAIPLALAPGGHTIELRAGNEDTATDEEDLFEATVIDR